MRKQIIAGLLTLLLMAGVSCLAAMADGSPDPPTNSGNMEQQRPADSSPTPAISTQTPKPGLEQLPDRPTEGTAHPEQTPSPSAPDPSPVVPAPEEDGCNTMAELAAYIAQGKGGTVTVTDDLILSEGNVWLEARTPVTIDLGSHGIRIMEGAGLCLDGPIRLIGQGSPAPLLKVHGNLATYSGVEIQAAGDFAVAVEYGENAKWAMQAQDMIQVSAEGLLACAMTLYGGREVTLSQLDLRAAGEDAVGVRSEGPVRLFLCTVVSDGQAVDAPGLILDGSSADPMPPDVQLIQRVAAPKEAWIEHNGLCIAVGASEEELAEMLEDADDTLLYGFYDRAGVELMEFVSVLPGTSSSGTLDLSRPGSALLTIWPKWPRIGAVPLREWNIPVYAVDPESPWIEFAQTSFESVSLFYFREIQGADSITLWYSADGGKHWRDAAELPDASFYEDGAYLSSLPQPNCKYLFQLEVNGGPMAGRSNILTVPFYDEFHWDDGGDWDGGDRDDQGDLPPAHEEIPPPDLPSEEPADPPGEDGPTADEQPGDGDRPSRDERPTPNPEQPPATELPPFISPLPGGVTIVGLPHAAAQTAAPPMPYEPPEDGKAAPSPTPGPEPAQISPVPAEGESGAAPETRPADPPALSPPETAAPTGPSALSPSEPAGSDGLARPPPAEPNAPEGPVAAILPFSLCAGALLCGGVLLYLRKKGKLAKPVKWLPLLLAASLAASCLACWLCYRYDNKYTAPRPVSDLGVTRLDMDWYDADPLFYLADGWAFYRDKLLSPQEIREYGPDAFFYIGRYGGFDLGEAAAAPHGQGTYRTVVELDGAPRQFALELPPVFSRWRLWVNGELMQSVGMEDENAPAPARDLVTFTAADQIEIVVAAADNVGYYSGMVYPPALGSPRAVDGILSARLLLHGAAAALALSLGLVCLIAGSLLRFARPYRALSLLCLCLAGATAGPVLHSFGLGWTGSPGQRACYYGIFLALLWTVGQVCGLPRKLQWACVGVGGAVCALVLFQPLFPGYRAGTLFALSSALGLYKLLAALFILASSAWALRKGRRGSAALLCGGAIFAGALVMDRLLPVHEPIYGGWFVEMAGWAILALVGCAALWDTVLLYRADAALRTELAVRDEHARLQQDYVRTTRERLHESRSRFALMSHYLAQGELSKLRAYLDALNAPQTSLDSHQYTGNPLVDAVLAVQLARAERAGAATELDLAPLPESLPYADEDLTSLLMNLLDNALEANERLPSREDRWLTLNVEATDGALRLRCVNAAPPSQGSGTSKADKSAHGFGLSLLRKIAAEYGGAVEFQRLESCCAVTVTLNQNTRKEDAIP